jgi:hypothetical protein
MTPQLRAAIESLQSQAVLLRRRAKTAAEWSRSADPLEDPREAEAAAIDLVLALLANPKPSAQARQKAAISIDREAFAMLDRQYSDFSWGRKDQEPDWRWNVFWACAHRGIVNYPPPTALERVMDAYDRADMIFALAGET